MATVSFWLTYDHVYCALKIHVERLALRSHVIAARPDLMLLWGHVNLSILPYKKRSRTRSVHQNGLYFTYDEEVTIPNVKTTYIGGAGLRVRFYLSSGRYLKGKRLADECIFLHEISLTSERSYHIINLTPERSDLYARTRDHVAHRQVQGLFVGEAIRQAGRILRLASRPDTSQMTPSLAIQLNYDNRESAVIVHLQRANMLKALANVVVFEVKLVMIDGKVEYITRSNPHATDPNVSIIHEAFRLPIISRDIKFSTVVINVLVRKRMKKGISKHYYEQKGTIAFGANSSGDRERRHYREAFKDEEPTDLAWFPVRRPDKDMQIESELRDKSYRKRCANIVSPNTARGSSSNTDNKVADISTETTATVIFIPNSDCPARRGTPV